MFFYMIYTIDNNEISYKKLPIPLFRISANSTFRTSKWHCLQGKNRIFYLICQITR